LALLDKVKDQNDFHLNPDIGIRVEDTIEGCREGMFKWEKRLRKIRHASQEEAGGGLRSKVGRHVHNVMFPSKENTLVKLREVVVELRNDVGLVLGVLQM